MPFIIRCAAALAVGVFITASPASAQTYRWDDGGSGTNRNWDNAANWFNIIDIANDQLPVIGADVQFGTGYAVPIIINLNGDRTVNSLAFGVPAQTTLSGNTLTVSSGLVTVYANQFAGTSTTLPPSGPIVGGPVIINSNLVLGAPGVFDVRGNAELQTNGAITVAGGAGITRQGSGLWSIGGTGNTFSSLTLAHNLSSGTVATTRFGDVGNAAAGSLGLNAGGVANQISWGVRNRLLYTGSAANQTLSKNISLVFAGISEQAIYSFETFDSTGAVGPGAGSLTLAGTISGDLTDNGNAVSNSFNFNATSPTDPNFAVIISGNNTFRALTTIQGGIVTLAHDNALGSALTVVQFGSGATGAGIGTDASLLVNAGRTISQRIEAFGFTGDTTVYTLGGASDFTAGTSTFSGVIDFNTSAQSKGLTVVANGTSVVVLSGTIIGNTGSGTAQSSKFVKIGTGTVRLTASNSFTGDVEVRAGTLQLQGANGALTGTTGLVSVYTGGTLELNNIAGSPLARIVSGRGIDLRGGTLSLVAGNTNTMGALTIRPGAGSLVVDPNGGSSEMRFASLTRPGSGVGMGGTVDFRAVNGGVLGSTARVFISTAPSQTNGIIGGWATVNGSDWATHNGLDGVTAFTSYVPFASAIATSNAIVGNGATTDAIAAINSLKIATTAAGGNLNASGLLMIGTGGVLQTGGQTFSITNALSTGSTDLIVTTDGTLTLSGAVSTTGLNKSGAGTLVLNAPVTLTGTSASINVNAGTLSFQGDNRVLGDNRLVNLNSTAAVGIDLNNTSQTLGGLSGTGSVSIGTGTLTIRQPDIGADALLSGVISGSGAIVKTGIRAQRLTGDNPFTGSITVNRGNLTLTGVNQAAGAITLQQVGDFSAGLTLSGRGTLTAASTQPITIGPGAGLSLVNDDASLHPSLANNLNRIADTRPITLAGGSISFEGSLYSAVASSETLGALTIQPGASSLRSFSGVDPFSFDPLGPTALTFASVTRNAGSIVNVFNVRDAGFVGAAGNNPRILFNSGLGSEFLPWATTTSFVGSGSNTATSFMTYNTNGLAANGNGLQTLASAAQVAFASAGAADHALLTGGGSLAAPKTVASLQINPTAAAQSLNLGANNLVIGSGGLLFNGSQNYSITGTGTLGQPGTELIIHVHPTTSGGNPILTIATPIAANGLTKAGGTVAGVLSLTANNTYTGPTTVGTGYLQVLNPITSATDSATGTGPVSTFPRTLLVGGNTTGTAGQITGPVTVGGTLAPAALEAGTPSILTVRNDVTFSPNGTGEFFVLLGGNTVGTQYSRLRVIDGDVVLNGALFSPSFSGTPNGPLAIVELTGGTISGQFTTTGGVPLVDGAVFATFNGTQWFIDYTPTSIVVAPVPEPSSVLALCAAAAGAVGLVRRRVRGRTASTARSGATRGL